MTNKGEPTYPEVPGHVDSETSMLAAHSQRSKAAIVRDQVFGKISEAGANGLTGDEIEVKMGICSGTRCGRVRELVLMGEVVDSGKRRLTRRGRLAAVWIVDEKEGNDE